MAKSISVAARELGGGDRQGDGNEEWAAGGRRHDYKGAQRKTGRNEYAHYINYGDVSRVNIYVKINQTEHFKYVQFIICQLYLNKTVFKKRKSLPQTLKEYNQSLLK